MNFKKPFLNWVALISISFLTSSAHAADSFLEDLSTLGKSCTTRSFVSGIVAIPIRARNDLNSVSVYVYQYLNNEFVTHSANLALNDASTDLYTIYVDTTRLRNGWANIGVSGMGTGGFYVYLYVTNSSYVGDGKVLSIAPSHDAAPAPAPILSPNPTLEPSPVPIPEPTSLPKQKKCRARHCR